MFIDESVRHRYFCDIFFRPDAQKTADKLTGRIPKLPTDRHFLFLSDS